VSPARQAAGPAGLYVAMLGAGALAFALTRHLGQSLIAPERPPGQAVFGAPGTAASLQSLMQLLLALLVVVVAARVLGLVGSRFGQPPVVGEIVAGILLGPSLLGRLWPHGAALLFPPEVTDHLGVVAQLGVIAFMFLVGLQLNLAEIREHSRAMVLISHASIVLPFVLGTGLALYLYPRYATRDVPFGVFALFSGVAMSVTAFPVLARILADRRLQETRLGALALACAAADDATAWCLLALVTGVARADANGGLPTLGLALAYVVVMFGAVRPLLRRLVARIDGRGAVSRGVLTAVFAGLVLSALTTEWIGIHALFGAFLAGALVPHDSGLARELAHKLNDFVIVVLLPAFFALTGLRTTLGVLGGAAPWGDLLLVIAVASVGKFGGAFVSGRLVGLSVNDASVLGTLMNTRGLMELVVLNVGLELGVLSPPLFAILVVMAIATTMATTPILDRLVPHAPLARAPVASPAAALPPH
jgi:K+:H+ antiporter